MKKLIMRICGLVGAVMFFYKLLGAETGGL